VGLVECPTTFYGVDFHGGINTETYKYYIDFASKYGIPYIILDEGWLQAGQCARRGPGKSTSRN